MQSTYFSPHPKMTSVPTYQLTAAMQLHLPKLPFVIQRSKRAKIISRRISGKRMRESFREHMRIHCAVSGTSNRYMKSDDDGFRPEPFWSSLIKDAFWGLRSLVVFLVEQPSQLRYIEWPSFQSTLRTATLTLVLVALLIVALSSVDSVLYYLLALLLRRTA